MICLDFDNKVCTHCNESKPLDAFLADKTRCKACWAIYMKEYRATHLAQKKANDRDWYQRHLAERRAYQRQYRLDHPEQVKEASRRWHAANPRPPRPHDRIRQLTYTYGLSENSFHWIMAAQGGVCAICDRPPLEPAEGQKHNSSHRLHLDHSHATGKIRGFLCSGCNTGLGNLGEDVERLEKAIAYLRCQ